MIISFYKLICKHQHVDDANNLEMDVIEVLNFLDSEEDTLQIDEEAFIGLANALECLGVREDDIKYLGAKMTASEDLQKTDIKFIQ